jgi:hypothetical protein
MFLALITLLSWLSVAFSQTVYLAGDSTMALASSGIQGVLV